MSENCSQNCESCSENCNERKAESLLVQPHEMSHIKKVIAVVSGKGRWMLQSSTAIPASSRIPLFKGEGCFPLDLKLVGSIELPKEEPLLPVLESENSLEHSFDDAFDSEF